MIRNTTLYKSSASPVSLPHLTLPWPFLKAIDDIMWVQLTSLVGRGQAELPQDAHDLQGRIFICLSAWRAFVWAWVTCEYRYYQAILEAALLLCCLLAVFFLWVLLNSELYCVLVPMWDRTDQCGGWLLSHFDCTRNPALLCTLSFQCHIHQRWN